MATRWGIPLQSSLAVLLFCAGCSQTVLESKPYRIVTPAGTNYYWVTITANSLAGKTEYSARAFPTWAVDVYLGRDVSLPRHVDQEARMRDKMHESMAELYDKYADAVKRLDFNEASKDAEGLLALQGVPLFGGENTDPIDSAYLTQVQFNVVRNLVDFNCGKKHVIALSNDPDAILNAIAAIGEEPRTTNAVTDAMLAMMGLTGSGQFIRANQESKAVQAAGGVIASLGTDDAITSIHSVEDAKANIVQVKSLLETLP
jgi:hypothetical protein